jgi:NADPH:quinone reductase-like Zn-dependent oxidoreductase
MKAIVHTEYGPPEVAKLKEIEKPQPGENDILIKVYATTVNRTDQGFRSAEYFVSRFWSGLFKPKKQVLGCEFSGIVEAVGSEVSLFKIGDKVFGYDDGNFGGHAEYKTIEETAAVTHIPNNLDSYEAAAMTEGSHYAHNYIKAGQIKPGQNILVYGATGAIGSAAVQLLKYYGATVTAVSNTKNVELVRSLGADEVIDYQKQDFTQTSHKFDMAFDAVGKSSFKECKPLLKEKGIYVSTELGKNCENIFLALLTPIFGGKRVLFPIPTSSKEEVQFLRDLTERSFFKPVIDRYYNLETLQEAYRYVETGQKTGNVIIKVC